MLLTDTEGNRLFRDALRGLNCNQIIGDFYKGLEKKYNGSISDLYYGDYEYDYSRIKLAEKKDIDKNMTLQEFFNKYDEGTFYVEMKLENSGGKRRNYKKTRKNRKSRELNRRTRSLNQKSKSKIKPVRGRHLLH
jgi:hypothetical protein